MNVDPKLTLEEIESMTCNTLTVKQVADFLGKDPQTIRDQADRDIKPLGFNISKAGCSYCIPRLAFIAWVKGKIPIMVIDQYSGCLYSKKENTI